jgi:large repetitive protein
VLQPSSVNLPAMAAGDVYFGELSLTNHGLVRADNLRQTLPRVDPYFRFEFLAPVPESLGAKQRVTLPYRVIALQSLEGSASSANASGGGCYNYNNGTTVESESQCANGDTSKGATSTNFFRFSNSSCPIPSGSSVPVPWTRPSCTAWCGDKCCGGGGPGGYGGPGGASLLPGGPRCVNIPRNGVEMCQ